MEILPSGGQHVSFPALQTGLASSNVRTSLMDSSMWTRAAREHVTCAPGAETRSNACESPIQRGGIQIRPSAATQTVSRPSPLVVSSPLARTQVATIPGTRKNRRLVAQVCRTHCRSAASPPPSRRLDSTPCPCGGIVSCNGFMVTIRASACNRFAYMRTLPTWYYRSTISTWTQLCA